MSQLMLQLRNTAFSAIDELFQGCLTTVHFQRYQECLTSHAGFLRSLRLFQLQQSLLVLLSLSMLPFCVISHVPGNSNVSILCDYQRLIFVPLISTFYHRDRRATLRSRGTLVTHYMGGGGAKLFKIFKILEGGACVPSPPPYSAVPVPVLSPHFPVYSQGHLVMVLPVLPLGKPLNYIH